MKLSRVSLFFALLVAVCVPAVAQSAKMRLEIPFNFTVAGKSLPAGQYTAVPVLRSDDNVWSICSEHDACANVLTHPETPGLATHPRTMVFVRTTEGYALVQFWPTERLGRNLPMPKERILIADDGDKDKYIQVSAK
jgi:hypothetical protein